jgi:ribosomal protein L44E
MTAHLRPYELGRVREEGGVVYEQRTAHNSFVEVKFAMIKDNKRRKGGKHTLLEKKCQQCGQNKVRELAPVFQERVGRRVQLVLLCWNCYLNY